MNSAGICSFSVVITKARVNAYYPGKDNYARVRSSKPKVKYRAFPEDGIRGEYFFSFGSVNIGITETGVVKKMEINPGTIVLNRNLTGSGAQQKPTLLHELIHWCLGSTSFCCRRYSEEL